MTFKSFTNSYRTDLYQISVMELPKIFVKYGQNSFWKIGTFLFQYFRKSRENVNDLLKNQNWKLKLKTKMG